MIRRSCVFSSVFKVTHVYASRGVFFAYERE